MESVRFLGSDYTSFDLIVLSVSFVGSEEFVVLEVGLNLHIIRFKI